MIFAKKERVADVVKQKRLFMISLLLLMLTGCGMMDKASDALGNFSDE